jgi:flagellar operon protein
MNISNNTFLSIEQAKEQYLHEANGNRQARTGNDGYSFGEVLAMKEASQSEELVFSKHAKNRLNERNIDLTSEQLDRLQEGTDKAKQKGIQESLVLVDNLAFIVNIKNRTVITAMDQRESNEYIFTNIDGAVIS